MPDPSTGPSLERIEAPSPSLPERRLWHPPVLERLGPWSALTLQQSIPIGPGTGMLTPRMPNPERLA